MSDPAAGSGVLSSAVGLAHPFDRAHSGTLHLATMVGLCHVFLRQDSRVPPRQRICVHLRGAHGIVLSK